MRTGAGNHRLCGQRCTAPIPSPGGKVDSKMTRRVILKTEEERRHLNCRKKSGTDVKSQHYCPQSSSGPACAGSPSPREKGYGLRCETIIHCSSRFWSKYNTPAGKTGKVCPIFLRIPLAKRNNQCYNTHVNRKNVGKERRERLSFLLGKKGNVP